MKTAIIAHMRSNVDGLTVYQAEAALAAVAAAIRDVAKTESSARVPGLGMFKMKARAARVARNPRTGETVNIPARTSLTFKESKA